MPTRASRRTQAGTRLWWLGRPGTQRTTPTPVPGHADADGPGRGGSALDGARQAGPTLGRGPPTARCAVAGREDPPWRCDSPETDTGVAFRQPLVTITNSTARLFSRDLRPQVAVRLCPAGTRSTPTPSSTAHPTEKTTRRAKAASRPLSRVPEARNKHGYQRGGSASAPIKDGGGAGLAAEAAGGRLTGAPWRLRPLPRR